MKLIIYKDSHIEKIVNVAGVAAYTAEEITVVKNDAYLKTETLLDARSFVIAPDSDACLALEGTGVDTEPLYDFLLQEYI